MITLKATTVKQQVCAFLQLSETDYTNFQFEQAYKYLKAYLPVFEQITEEDRTAWIQALTETKVFWQWWTRQWEKRDEVFIAKRPEAGLNNYFSKMKYKELHNAENLCNSTKMYGRVTNEAYEKMVHSVIKAEVRR